MADRCRSCASLIKTHTTLLHTHTHLDTHTSLSRHTQLSYTHTHILTRTHLSQDTHSSLTHTHTSWHTQLTRYALICHDMVWGVCDMTPMWHDSWVMNHLFMYDRERRRASLTEIGNSGWFHESDSCIPEIPPRQAEFPIPTKHKFGEWGGPWVANIDYQHCIQISLSTLYTNIVCTQLHKKLFRRILLVLYHPNRGAWESSSKRPKPGNERLFLKVSTDFKGSARGIRVHVSFSKRDLWSWVCGKLETQLFRGVSQDS